MREYRRLLRDVAYEFVSLDYLGIRDEMEETEDTFAENASLKARAHSALSGLLTLADDSGLEVDALGGEPGVRSARYGEKSPLAPLYERGGPDSLSGRGGQDIPPPKREEEMSDRNRVELLLGNLKGVPWERRTARFRCVIAIATPPSPPFARGGMGGLTLVAGSVAGMIQYEPMGNGGFGYDPVFYLPSYGLTMAQLPLEEKNRISHRAEAAGEAVKALKQALSPRSSLEN